MPKKKVKTVKAKVTKVKTKPRIRKTERYHKFEVWGSDEKGRMDCSEPCDTLKKAEKCIKDNDWMVAPIIVEINIPPIPM